ncbi:MAG: hypothetical protein HY303_21225 [Candidatus Wallbacteria bacterium]|nr:hypothetical protein [Candidatus Wallbacteria bacterium]
MDDKGFYDEYYGYKNGLYLDRYMVVPITTPEDTSMYAVSHFLSRLKSDTGQELVGCALSKWGLSDFDKLDSALVESGGVSGAFASYGRQMLDEQAKSPLFQLILRKMSDGQRYLLGDTKFFGRARKTLSGMSGVAVIVAPKAKGEAKLIIDATRSTGDLLWGDIFMGGWRRNNQQVWGVPDFSAARSKPVTNVFLNCSHSSDATLDVAYYTLVPQSARLIREGEVQCDLVGVGSGPYEIPPEYFLGVRLYRDSGEHVGFVAVPSSGHAVSFTTSTPQIRDGLCGCSEDPPVYNEGTSYYAVLVTKQGFASPEPAPQTLSPTFYLTLTDLNKSSDVCPELDPPGINIIVHAAEEITTPTIDLSSLGLGTAVQMVKPAHPWAVGQWATPAVTVPRQTERAGTRLCPVTVTEAKGLARQIRATARVTVDRSRPVVQTIQGPGDFSARSDTHPVLTFSATVSNSPDNTPMTYSWWFGSTRVNENSLTCSVTLDNGGGYGYNADYAATFVAQNEPQQPCPFQARAEHWFKVTWVKPPSAKAPGDPAMPAK